MKKHEIKLLENRLQKRLQSNIQSYDIRDSPEFAGAIEIEKLLQTQIAKEARAVDIAAAFKQVVKQATLKNNTKKDGDSFDTDSDLN